VIGLEKAIMMAPQKEQLFYTIATNSAGSKPQ
jgi:hypothetical protein